MFSETFLRKSLGWPQRGQRVMFGRRRPATPESIASALAAMGQASEGQRERLVAAIWSAIDEARLAAVKLADPARSYVLAHDTLLANLAMMSRDIGRMADALRRIRAHSPQTQIIRPGPVRGGLRIPVAQLRKLAEAKK